MLQSSWTKLRPCRIARWFHDDERDLPRSTIAGRRRTNSRGPANRSAAAAAADETRRAHAHAIGARTNESTTDRPRRARLDGVLTACVGVAHFILAKYCACVRLICSIAVVATYAHYITTTTIICCRR